ncbi:septation protein A [Dongshaea marina]|uniref:septation protein A n=1 Tax=Dongshaea marina TaxID=2047966 RepID=UPI000D3E570D|nr:septation protein A [Dongshaea marina]
MKQFYDFIPLIVFFAVYKFADIYYATGALVICTAVQVAISWIRYRKVEKMLLVTFVLVAFFGGLTIFFHDDVFIKWKVTAVNVLFAIALLVSQYGFNKPLIKQLLSKEITLPEPVWNKINLAWALFFLFCGAINLYVAFWLPLSVWVNFKVFGLLGLTLLFTLGTGVYLYKHIPADQRK